MTQPQSREQAQAALEAAIEDRSDGEDPKARTERLRGLADAVKAAEGRESQ